MKSVPLVLMKSYAVNRGPKIPYNFLATLIEEIKK